LNGRNQKVRLGLVKLGLLWQGIVKLGHFVWNGGESANWCTCYSFNGDIGVPTLNGT
jgi:hypothetical protein